MPRTTIDLEPTILDAEGRRAGPWDKWRPSYWRGRWPTMSHPVEEFRWTAKAMGARIDLDDADAVRRAAGDR